MENSFESLEAYWKQQNKKEESKNVLNKEMITAMLASRTQTIFEKAKILVSVPMGFPLLFINQQFLFKELSINPWLSVIIIIIYGFVIYTSVLNYQAWHTLIHGKLSEESIITTIEKMLRILKKIKNYNYYFYLPVYAIVLPMIVRRIFLLIFPDKGTIALTIAIIIFIVFTVLYFIKIIFPSTPGKDALRSVIKELETTSEELKM